MTTINDVPNEMITYMAQRMPLAVRANFMQCSKALYEICTADPVWAPMVRELFLMKRWDEQTCYQMVKHFHERFNEFSDAYLPKPASESIIAKTSNWVRSWLSAPAEKEISYDANKRRWNSQPAESRRNGILRVLHLDNRADIEIAFHLLQMDPQLVHSQLCVSRAIEQAHWPILMRLARLESGLQLVVLRAIVNGRLVVKDPVSVIRDILKTGLLSELESSLLLKDARANAFESAVCSGNLVALDELLNLGEISLEEAAKYYELAAYQVCTNADALHYAAVMNRLEEKYPHVAEASANMPWCKHLAENGKVQKLDG